MHISIKINFKSLYDLLIFAYRITNRAKIIPIITITNAPTVPPTVTVKLPDEEKDIDVVSGGKKRNPQNNNVYNIIQNHLYNYVV